MGQEIFYILISLFVMLLLSCNHVIPFEVSNKGLSSWEMWEKRLS